MHSLKTISIFYSNILCELTIISPNTHSDTARGKHSLVIQRLGYLTFAHKISVPGKGVMLRESMGASRLLSFENARYGVTVSPCGSICGDS